MAATIVATDNKQDNATTLLSKSFAAGVCDGIAVAVKYGNKTTVNCTSVKFNGIDLTIVDGATVGTGIYRIEFWVGITTGGTHNVDVAFNNTDAGDRMFTVWSGLGIDQTTPGDLFTSIEHDSSATGDITVSGTTVNDIVLSALAYGFVQGLTPGSGVTKDSDFTGTQTHHGGAGHKTGGAGSTTSAWTTSAGNTNLVAAIRFKAATVAPAPVIDLLTPASIAPNTVNNLITIDGSNFVNDGGLGVVIVPSTDLTVHSVTFVSSTQLTCMVDATSAADPGTRALHSTQTAGGSSNAVDFDIVVPSGGGINGGVFGSSVFSE